jgi:glycolate oxidase
MTDVMKRSFYEGIEKKKVLDELIKIFGKSNVSDKPHDIIPYSYDMTESEPKMPDFTVLPETVDEIVQLVKFCNQYKVPIVPYVSGNNVGGLTIPEEGGIVCDMGKRMKKIITINESLMYAILEPGVTFGQLKKYLDENHPTLKYGYAMAPPYASVVVNALLSGLSNLSTKLGSMADMINGLEIVLYNGEVVRTGSCFLSKELKYDNWFVRYPMPDLTGLFIGWQGTTGIVTKCALQLWPRKKYNTAVMAIVYTAENCAAVIREFGKSECCEDVCCITSELAKMGFGLKKPPKYENEPDYVIMISVSGNTKELINAKINYLKQILEDIKENAEDKRMFLVNMDTIINIVGKDFSVFYNIPSVLKPLYEWDGLTWIGSYTNPDHLALLMNKIYPLYKKYDLGPMIYSKSMKASHYVILRPIIRFHKGREQEKVREMMHEMLDLMLDYNCVPYKAPSWMTEEIRKRCDPNWIKLLERIKNSMDPNDIFNPGKWCL